jgi:hypothetical protein
MRFEIRLRLCRYLGWLDETDPQAVCSHTMFNRLSRHAPCDYKGNARVAWAEWDLRKHVDCYCADGLEWFSHNDLPRQLSLWLGPAISLPAVGWAALLATLRHLAHFRPAMSVDEVGIVAQ